MSKIRNGIKLFIPPILLQFLSSPRKPHITNEGVFKNFDEVFKHYQNSTNYDAQDSLQEAADKAAKELQNLEAGNHPNISYELIRLNILSYLTAGLSKEKLSVLDIGGGFGASFLNMLSTCPSTAVDFFVAELPETTTKAKEIFQNYDNIKFIEEMPSPDQHEFDIVNFGSSLQYFPNYSETLTSCAQYQADYIVISDTPMGPAETFVCAQVNMADRTIPRWVFNLEEITSTMRDNGYQLIHKSVNYYEFHNFSNYDGKEAQSEQYNLIFKRS